MTEGYVYIEDVSRYRCCLWRVEAVAFVLAIVFGSLDIGSFARLYRSAHWTFSAMIAIDLFCCIGIVMAGISEEPFLYAPFLVFNGLRILLCSAVSVALLILLAISADVRVDFVEWLRGIPYSSLGIDGPVEIDPFALFFLVSSVALIVLLLLVCHQTVVYRAMESTNNKVLPIAEVHEVAAAVEERRRR